MVIAVGTVVSGLTALAANESVQAGALRLAKDVYGRIMPSRVGRVSSIDGGPVSVAATIDQSATREEMAAALATLQAALQNTIENGVTAIRHEAERRQRTLIMAVAAVIALQLTVLVAIIW